MVRIVPLIFKDVTNSILLTKYNLLYKFGKMHKLQNNLLTHLYIYSIFLIC